jgi:hypothetical protein
MSDEKQKFLEQDEFCISLTIRGDDLEPDETTRLLGAAPTDSCRRGDIPGRGRKSPAEWGMRNFSTQRSTDDIEKQLTDLFARLNGNKGIWDSTTQKYDADLFCGVFLSWFGHGFSMSPQLHRLLADRNLLITFDIYGEYDHDADKAPKPN